jgi:uncharacterized repeat protein (TIGR04138 family)
MQKVDFGDAVDAAVVKDPRYPADAYHFLQGVLSDALRQMRKETGGEDRHVGGGELLEAFRLGALREFGPMALTVLNEWGLLRCEDVGELVFNLIDVGAFGKSDTDRREDFEDGYDFREAFELPFLPASKRGTQADAELSR